MLRLKTSAKANSYRLTGMATALTAALIAVLPAASPASAGGFMPNTGVTYSSLYYRNAPDSSWPNPVYCVRVHWRVHSRTPLSFFSYENFKTVPPWTVQYLDTGHGNGTGDNYKALYPGYVENYPDAC